MPPPLALQCAVDPASQPEDAKQALAPPQKRGRFAYTVYKFAHHMKVHFGVGLICSVAYFDPGNWSVDLQAGSIFGYRPMLFIILMAGLGAVILQTMACKLGCVTGLDLAMHCRLLLYNRPKHTRLIRYGVLYPMYIACEVAIISTDLAELIGSAIGICLLIPAIPLWAGVLLTASDVLIFLVIGDPTRRNKRPVRLFEFTIVGLVMAVLISFIILLVRVNVRWPQAFFGYIPSKRLFQSKPNALYTAIGILGATVMPHALFLGSFLATQDRVSKPAIDIPAPATSSNRFLASVKTWLRGIFIVSRAERQAADRDYQSKYVRAENNSLEFIRAHMGHGIVDIVTSLLGVAVPINSAILIIAATVFFVRDGDSDSNVPAGLFEAHDLIRDHIGKAAAFIFALALLCAGQAASITATLAGQIVSEGFIAWRISPFLRRLITRLLGLIPSMIVAIAVGRNGIDSLLVASQVALSIVLPFVVLPLVWLTSSKNVMSVDKPREPPAAKKAESDVVTVAIEVRDHAAAGGDKHDIEELHETVHDHSEVASISQEVVDFSNGRTMMGLGYLIWVIVVLANAYVLIQLFLGNS